ncbi:hypothetical protein F4825DRAFT_10067 [Nemania diffusa]|nr:hypothetical protein F4825DRAFT_10067 [Nemania diffusa]
MSAVVLGYFLWMVLSRVSFPIRETQLQLMLELAVSIFLRRASVDNEARSKTPVVENHSVDGPMRIFALRGTSCSFLGAEV